MQATWTSQTPDGFLKEVDDLWKRTHHFFPNTDQLDCLFGEGGTWYFWDETWADACGPFPSEEEARTAVQVYVETL